MFTTGWLLCVTYADHSPAWMHNLSWNTILGVKQSTTRNAQNRRDRKRQKGHRKRNPNPEDKWNVLVTQLRGPKEWDTTQCLLSSPAGEHRLSHSLNLSGSSLFYFFIQSIELSFSFDLKQNSWGNGTHVNCFTLCLNSTCQMKTFNP